MTTNSPTKLDSTPISTNVSEAIPQILDFWFDQVGAEPVWWFMPPKEMDIDNVITSKFSHMVEKALHGDELEQQFTTTPEGTLAFLLLTDQFPRNIYRPGRHEQPGKSWAGDAKALRITTAAMAKNWDREVQSIFSHKQGSGYYQRYFFYLPLEHAEDLMSQICAVNTIKQLCGELQVKQATFKAEGTEEPEDAKKLREWAEYSVSFAEKHLVCVRENGKFPSRDKPLGRESSKQDLAWLEQHPMGF